MQATMLLAGTSRTFTFEGTTQLLSIRGMDGDAVSIATSERGSLTPADMDAVHSLRDAVEQFTAECERQAAQQTEQAITENVVTRRPRDPDRHGHNDRDGHGDGRGAGSESR